MCIPTVEIELKYLLLIISLYTNISNIKFNLPLTTSTLFPITESIFSSKEPSANTKEATATSIRKTSKEYCYMKLTSLRLETLLALSPMTDYEFRS